MKWDMADGGGPLGMIILGKRGEKTMQLKRGTEGRTRVLAHKAFDARLGSDAIINEIQNDVHGHVRAPLRDIGLDWREPWWSERGEYACLKGAWGAGDGT